MNFTILAPSMTFDVPLDDGASIRMRRHGCAVGVVCSSRDEPRHRGLEWVIFDISEPSASSPVYL